MLAATLVLMSAAIVSAGSLVRVTGNNRAWSDTRALDISQMAPYARVLETLDPNFEEDGKQGFKGIGLAELLSLAGLDNTHGLTVIGSDQYVGYLTPELAAQGMLVWEMDGRPVSRLKGGPLKVIFPQSAGVHASCFTWYVSALVQGRPRAPDLKVVSGGRKQQFSFARLVSQSHLLASGRVSIAQGCRNEFSEPASDKPARAVRLRDVTGELPRGAVVELQPYYGPSIRLGAEALAFGAKIIVGCGTRSLHPALGGPYAIIFPVEDHGELRDLVPESGAFFFLKAIVVE